VSFLIDINVLSELRRKRPSPAVQSWFQVHSAPTLFLSVLTIGEIRKGIEGVSDPIRRQALNGWLEGERIAGRRLISTRLHTRANRP